MEAIAGGIARVDVAELNRRADRARRRVDESTTGSPDWDAAMAELEELEARLAQPLVVAEPVELAG